MTRSATGGQLAVVGSYGTAGLPTISVIEVGPGAGLRHLASFDGLEHASYVLPAPGGVLFATSEREDGLVASFRLRSDASAIGLEPMGTVGTGGAMPCHLALDPSGRWLCAANYGSGSIALLEVGPDGRLLGRRSMVQHAGSGPRRDRQSAPHAHATCFAPDGIHVIAADLGADRVFVHRLDPDAGVLTTVGAVATGPGSGPRHLVFSADGRYVFVVQELTNTVASFRWDPAAGGLDPVDVRSTVPAGSNSDLAAAIRPAPSGRHLFVSNRGDDSVAVIEVDRGGRFGALTTTPTGGAWPRDIAVTPGGDGLVVANERSGLVTLVPIGADGASLGAAAAAVELPDPSSVAFL